MNIAELASKTRPAEGTTPAQLTIQMTAHSAANTDPVIIEQAFHQLCTELNAQGSINVVSYSENENKLQ